MFHHSRLCLVVQQVSEDPADFLKSQQRWHFLHFSVIHIFQEFNSVPCAFLRRFIDRNNAGANTQRNVGVDFVSGVKEADPLMARDTPVVKKLVNDSSVFKHYVIDMSVSLTIECDSRRLAFWANAFRPWRMFTTSCFDLAVDVLKCDKLSSRHSWGCFTQVRVERQMLNLLLLEIVFVIRLKWWAVHAAIVGCVPAKIWVFFPLDATVEFEEFNINSIFNDSWCFFFN